MFAPDRVLQTAAAAAWQESEQAERSVDRLDADATLAEADATRRSVNLAEVRQLELAAHWADLHAVLDTPASTPAGEKLVSLGGDGTPEIAEFAAAELALSLRVSEAAAGQLIGDALDLRHRFPLLWDRLHHGATPVWMARKTAQASRFLSKNSAGSVDRQITRYHGHLTWARLRKAVHAAILRADPPKALSDAEQAASQAAVTWRKDDVEHGYATMIIKAAAGDLAAFDQSLDLVARALKILGDTRSPDQRRAAAIAILADPATAQDLVDRAEATRRLHAEAAAARRAGHSDLADAWDQTIDRRPLIFTNATVYYHLTRDTLQDILNGAPHAELCLS